MPPSTRRRGEVFACVAAPAHASPDPAHGRHELRSYWRILRAQPRRRSRASGQASAKFADMTAKESTAKERARVAAQRGHSTPEALHTPAAWPQGHGTTSTKTKSCACPTWTPAQSTHARHVGGLLALPPACRPAAGAGRTVESRENQSTGSRTWYILGTQGRRAWAARQRATGPLVTSPRPRSRSTGCGGAVGTP
jgi:hypothetical protein